MKDVTNVLVVLFLIVGAGLVSAGKGECKSPETTVEVTMTYSYYPSGNPKMTSELTTSTEGAMFCEGEEGDCETRMDPNASSGSIKLQWWMYNDDSDDSNMLMDSGTTTYTIRGRTVC